MKKTCPVCRGEYDSVQRGAPYLHACAPMLESITVRRGDRTLTVKPDQVRALDVEIDRQYADRPGAIDENRDRPAEGEG